MRRTDRALLVALNGLVIASLGCGESALQAGDSGPGRDVDAATGDGDGDLDSGASGGDGDGAAGNPHGDGDGGGPQGSQSCGVTSDRVRITEVDVGHSVLSSETDAVGALLHPIVIASKPSGGSRLAWMSDNGQTFLATLDADDHLMGSPAGFGAHSLADVYADDTGGVLLVARDAAGGGDKQCGTLDNLCGAQSERAWQGQWSCWDMYLVRFEGSAEKWATNLTESRADNPPFLASTTAQNRVVYIWEAFAHHGRIASSGSSYAAYFGASISVSQSCTSAGSIHPTGINIHQGDRMQIVGLDGALQNGGFGWGCSHSGYERVVWDPAAKRYVAACKTDNDNRLAMPDPYRTIRSVDLWYANLSDLVPAVGGGIWVASSDIRPGQPANNNGLADVHLLRFSNGAADKDLTVVNTQGENDRAPHLAAYGADRMLLAWESSATAGDLGVNDKARQLHVQTVDRATGEREGDALTVDVRGNRYHKLVSYPDGSVAFVARGSTGTRIKIMRVLPCGS
ncbi:MAG: hypothetical protein QM778_30900 [Myxococcales bacterium]